MNRSVFALSAAFALMASPVLAHTGAGSMSGLWAGFAHPMGGLDHVLAMVAVGVLAAQSGGRSLWLVPAAFVAMMVFGGALGVAGVSVPLVMLGVVGSVVLLGAVIAVGRRLPMAVAMALVGALAVFHGHAHGAEMPLTAAGLDYGAGVAAATALLHAIGIGLAMGVRRAGESFAPQAIRIGGGTIAAAGVALMVIG